MAVGYVVEEDDGTLLVTLTGRLTLADVGSLRLKLYKSLADEPQALVVDLTALAVSEPLALSVFGAVGRQAERWPGVPVLYAAPSPQARRLLDVAAYRRLPLFETVAEARHQALRPDRGLTALSDELPPLSGAARQARNLATEACLRWDLPHLVGPACLIVSELVSNVADHASTMATVRLSLHRRFLTIAVRDGSTEPPAMKQHDPMFPGKGRGLLLVHATADSWGWLPTEGGKVVWASLRRDK